MLQPRLRGGYRKSEPFPLNQVPRSIVEGFCRRFVYCLATDRNEISGEDWSRIFAEAIQGSKLDSPLGIADVTWEDCCWSQKTIKHKKPHELATVRLIVARASPTYSFDIDDPKADVQGTGNAVLSIYNQRIDEARSKYRDTRLGVLIRNMSTLEYCYFERALVPYSVNDYVWRLNDRQNLEASDGDVHQFTWQPHGSQLTLLETVPRSAIRFRLNQKPEVVSLSALLTDVSYSPEWVDVR